MSGEVAASARGWRPSAAGWFWIVTLSFGMLIFLSGVIWGGTPATSSDPCKAPNPTKYDVYACADKLVRENPYENRR